MIQRFSEDIYIGIYKADLHVPLEADIAALPSINQQQRALAEKVDEAARQYISGPIRELLTKEFAVVEEAAERPGHFSPGFGFDLYRNREALDILVLGYKSVFEAAGSYVQAAVRIEGGARPDPEPAEPREIVPYIGRELKSPPMRRTEMRCAKRSIRSLNSTIAPGAFRAANSSNSMEISSAQGLPQMPTIHLR